MSEAAARSFLHRWGARLLAWSERVKLTRKLTFALAAAAVAAGIATVASWTGAARHGPDPDTTLALLVIDGILLLLLSAVIARKLVLVWAERRQGQAGSGLHVRMVILFSLVAVTPAILVAVFSALFLNFGVQAWFSGRVRTAVEASNAVAAAYFQEHRQSIRAEALAMANDLNREAADLMGDPRLFDLRLSQQANLRSLPEALVVDGSGRVLARTPLSLSLELDLVPQQVIEKAAQGQVAVIANETDDRVRAAVRLNRFLDAYLLIGRFIDPGVKLNLARTETAVAQYRRLEEQREGILITFVFIFIVVALLLLLAAVWTGLALATQIARPVRGLVEAAEQVRRGDLSVRVEPTESVEEIDTLGRAFNRMTSQLEAQRERLIEANRLLDDRRRFTETILSGVSAGVIGLDPDGLINLPNRSATELLAVDLDGAIGRPLTEVVPEMGDLLARALAEHGRAVEGEVRLRRDGRSRTLRVRIVAERAGPAISGFVVTFDDLTALVSAQRMAAWADVARRIAHEIKNPLTPIQLAAERLQRRYRKEVVSDPETFSACTDTIVRRVEDIRRMVDEFSSFARMPRPDLNPENLTELLRQAVVLERNRTPAIAIELTVPDEPVRLVCDGRQLSQALINVLKNAAEAIVEQGARGNGGQPAGTIWVDLARLRRPDGTESVRISVEDNGPGLPADNRDRLAEPYVTTREKGTGLGLAIVKKIMEDHAGDLILEDREGGGARVILVFERVGGEGASNGANPASPRPQEEEARAANPAAARSARG